MVSTQLKTSTSFALTAALMALSASAFAATPPAGSTGKAIDANDKVHCYNVTECKGQNDCKTGANACKGQGSCKGQGFKAMAASACLQGKGVIGDLKG
jgi:hypothetical protein